MATRRTPTALLCLLVLAGALLWAAPAAAFHFPWDQGHDTFNPDHGDDDTDPGEDGPCQSGSPVELSSGNFVHSTHDVLVAGLGPALHVERYYNSRDMREGPFGHGWSFTYDQMLSVTTDGVSTYVVCHQGSGKRERFSRNPDGTYTSPDHLYSELVRNADGTFILKEKGGRQRVFSSTGRLTAIVDRTGNRLELTYDATGFLIAVTDAVGRELHFTKGPNGRVAAVTDPAGSVYSYRYDVNGNLVEAIDPLGQSRTYTYDAKHNLIRITDARGNVDQQITYDAQERVATLTDQGETWTYGYLTSPNRTTRRDGAGRTWTFFANDKGSVVRVADPLGHSELYTYDANSNIKSITDKNGGVTTIEHDARGNPISITDALGNRLSYTYGPFDRPTSLTDGLGRVTTFSYDAAGNLVRVVEPTGAERRMTYDPRGLLTSVTDANGNTTTFGYDAFGNTTTVTDALGNTSFTSYDELGNVVSVTDADGETDHFVYDELSRLQRFVNALGATTAYEYDAAGNLASLTDANGKATTFAYDAHDRLIASVNPLGQALSFSYDNKGNLLSVVDPKGQVVTFTYDVLNRRIRKDAPGETVTYTYDRAGNLLTVTNPDSRIEFEYDAVHRLRRARTAAHGVLPASVVEYGYNANGNRVSLTDPSGGVTSYDYDPFNRLSRITDFAGQDTIYSYDVAGRRAQVQRPNGIVTHHAYDAADRITEVLHQIGSFPTSSSRYGVDGPGNRTSIETLTGVNSYAYDPLYQLIGATSTDPLKPAESYTYDPAGNRLSSHLSSFYRYDDANRILEDESFTYQHDANGNLVGKTDKLTGATTTYTYDGEDFLRRIDFPDGSFATYRYDGLGRRIEKNVDGQITRFLYDGADVLQELAADGSVIARYTHGPGVDEPLSVERSGQHYFFLQDALGSVTAITDAAGQVVQEYEYDSFGRILSRSSSFPDTYAFAGRRYDAESDLYYNRARMYDPALGRFIQEDPIRFEGGLNLYSYVNNNPLNLRDPWGLRPCGDSWLDWLQTALDLGGLIPGFGEPLDLLNAGIYGLRGDYVNAGLSAAGAVPFAGWGATAGKLGRKAAAAGATEGIYEYTSKSGRQYVGQSNDIDRRLGEHIRDGRVTPEEAARATRTEVPGGKTAREIAEQRRIDELGGVDNLENVRNPIGQNRRHLMGGN